MSVACPSNTLKCLLVEDDPTLQDLLRELLLSIPRVEVVATAASVPEGIAACECHKPDLLLLDLALPGGSGIHIADSLITLNASAKIIIVSGQAASFLCPPSFRDNLHAVLNKTNVFESLPLEIESLP